MAGEMENSKVPCSWWCTTIASSSPDHHLRLLLTLSELNENMSALLRWMQPEDGEALTGQTETSTCPMATELQRRVEEFYTSYCSLAGYWGENFGSKVEPPDPSPELGIGSCRLQHLLPPEDDQLSARDAAGKIKIKNSDPEGPGLDVAGSLDQRISRSEQMSKIAEDVVGELARRYDEKREANRVLQCQAERMMEEGRVLRLDYERLVSENGALHSRLNSMTAGVGKNLRSCPRCSSLVKKQRRPLFSRFKSLFF